MVLPGPRRSNSPPTSAGCCTARAGGIAAGALFVLPSLVILVVLSWLYLAFGDLPRGRRHPRGSEAGCRRDRGRGDHPHRLARLAPRLPRRHRARRVRCPRRPLGTVSPGDRRRRAAGRGGPALTLRVPRTRHTPPARPNSLPSSTTNSRAGARRSLGGEARSRSRRWGSRSGCCPSPGWSMPSVRGAISRTWHASSRRRPWSPSAAPTRCSPMWSTGGRPVRLGDHGADDRWPGPGGNDTRAAHHAGGIRRVRRRLDKAALGPEALALAGIVGAMVATWFTFLPSFVFILAGGPYVERSRDDVHLEGPLSAITAAVVGVIASLAVFFAWHVFWPAASSPESLRWIGGVVRHGHRGRCARRAGTLPRGSHHRDRRIGHGRRCAAGACRLSEDA